MDTGEEGVSIFGRARLLCFGEYLLTREISMAGVITILQYFLAMRNLNGFCDVILGRDVASLVNPVRGNSFYLLVDEEGIVLDTLIFLAKIKSL